MNAQEASGRCASCEALGHIAMDCDTLKPVSSVEVIRDDILEKGTLLETMSRMKFPDAEKVGNAMAQLLDVVEGCELVGEWVSSVTNKEICEVSTFMYSYPHH